MASLLSLSEHHHSPSPRASSLSPKLPSLTPPGAVPSPFVVADRSQAGEEGGGVPGLGLVKDEEI